MKERSEQFAHQVLREVARIIREDVEVPKDIFVTVTRVSMSDDLKRATVFVTILPDNKRGTALEVLRKASGYIRHELSGVLSAYTTPKLSFQIDDKEMYAQEIDRLIDEL